MNLHYIICKIKKIKIIKSKKNNQKKKKIILSDKGIRSLDSETVFPSKKNAVFFLLH